MKTLWSGSKTFAPAGTQVETPISSPQLVSSSQSESPRKNPIPRPSVLFPQLFALSLLAPSLSAEEDPPDLLPASIIQAAPGPDGFLPLTFFDAEDLQAPGQPLDAVLGRDPAFRLFRATGSVAGHPTTQGFSLRNAGPSGASRGLMLLDGIPQNDPFGGWIPWSLLTARQPDRALTRSAGGVDPSGFSTLGGIVVLERFPRQPGSGQASIASGSSLQHDLSFRTALPADDVPLRLHAAFRSTEDRGFHQLAPEDRGPVDRRAGFGLLWGGAGFDVETSNGWRLNADLDVFDEERDNGTRLTKNRTRGFDWSARLRSPRSGPAIESEWLAYQQHRDFSSLFSAVSPERDTETPVLDQYSVPAQATGFIGRFRSELGTGHVLRFGGDLRFTEGETRELFRNLGDGFTRRRVAGGSSAESGLFLHDTWTPASLWQIECGVRLEHVRHWDGRQRERDLETGQSVLDADFASRKDWLGSGRLAVARTVPAWDIRWHGAIFTGNRQPTLNELYRPFRVGDDITLANPNLDSERLDGAELGLHWFPSESWSLSAVGFGNLLHDAVANVTLVEGPGVFPPWGFIPAGGSGRQRLNLDRIDSAGLELRSRWSPHPHFEWEAAWVWTRARVHSSNAQPALEGNQPPQVPDHAASLALHYNPSPHWRAALYANWLGHRYEDDLEERRLAASLTFDLEAQWNFRPGAALRLSLLNVLDSETESRKDGDGLVYLAAPRSAAVELSWSF